MRDIMAGNESGVLYYGDMPIGVFAINDLVATIGPWHHAICLDLSRVWGIHAGNEFAGASIAVNAYITY